MQETKLQISGLYTHPNPLGSTPEGALAVAENIVIDRENLGESRRGMKQYSSVAFDDPHKIINFDNTLLVHDDDIFVKDNGSGTFSNVNTVSYTSSLEGPAANVRVQDAQANQNLYLTTNKGVIKLDDATGTLQQAGVPRALDLSASLNATGSGPIADDTAVAYRVVWGIQDANFNLVLGAPSPRAEVNNTTGNPQTVNLTFSVPTDITTSHFYQIYRSVMSASAAVPGDDQLQLIIEAKYVSGTSITVTDTIEEEMLGAALYTNNTQEGIAQINDRPPYANYIAPYNEMMFYANTKQAQRMILTMIAQPGDTNTVTIDGQIYTAKTTGANVLLGEFNIGADIPTTVKNFTQAINQFGSNVSAIFLDAGSFFVERDDYGPAYTATTAIVGLFQQSLPVTSVEDRRKNGLYIAKSGQPEAVPELQYMPVGRADKEIIFIRANRDCMFVGKEDGIWRISGFSPSTLSLEAHDLTYKIVGPDCVGSLENAILCVSNKGVIAITTSGVEPISRPIEKDILAKIAYSGFAGLAWATSYPSDRKYILALQDSSASTVTDVLYIFNMFTTSWTTWPVRWSHAIVSEVDDKLYALRSTDSISLQERKSITLSDYADDEFAVTITGSTGYDVTLVSAASAVVGYTLKQNNKTAVITAINVNVITVDKSLPWDAAPATLYKPIPCKLRWIETHGGAPGIMKFFTELTFLFEQARFRAITVRVSSNFSPAQTSTILFARSASRWGRFPWGRSAWGSSLGGRQALRTFVARAVVRALWINIEVVLEQAFHAFGLAGATVSMNEMSSRFK